MHSQNRWLKGLNPEQREAVLHTRGPLLILAGAGSGKTTVLVSRTGRLLDEEKVQPSRLCVLTFTNKAARELKARVSAKIGHQARDIWTGTFHSFGLQWMRKHAKKLGLPAGFGVIDSSDAEGIVRELLKDTKIATKDAFRIDTLLEIMNEWREEAAIRGKKPETMGQNDGDDDEVMAAALLPRYEKRLSLLGVADFSDLLIRPLRAIRENDKLMAEFRDQFDYLMVDEFQDTNGLQLELVRDLSKGTGNIAVVGDDDQSIYGWRGARVANILEFPREFPGAHVVRLERNYRSSPAILSLANAVIANNKERHGKVLKPDPNADHGELPEFFSYESEELEVEETIGRVREFFGRGVTPSEVAVLYRSNGQGGLIEGELRREQIPYSITGGQGFFDRKEVKDVLAYIRCSISPNEVSYRRIVNTPPRGVGETTIERLSAWAEAQGVRFHVAARKWKVAGVQDKAGDSLDLLFLNLDSLAERLLKRGAGGAMQALVGDSPGARLQTFLREVGYRDHIRSLHKEGEAFEKRWFAIEVLGRVMDSFLARVETESGGELNENSLLKFIDSMELRDTIEDGKGNEEAKIQLLTLHACKGLEFDAVCLLGCEEDILPHRTLGGDISEERRLFYVGITRARKHLVLSRALSRRKFGRLAPTTLSRFVQELPEGYLTRFDSGSRPLAKAERTSKLGELMKKMEARTQELQAKEKAAVETATPFSNK